jgi:hypothetical protein
MKFNENLFNASLSLHADGQKWQNHVSLEVIVLQKRPKRFFLNSESSYSSSSILNRLWTGRLRNCDPIAGRSKKVSLLQNAQTGSWAHTVSYILGTNGSCCWGIQFLLPPSSAVKNAWSSTFIPPYDFMACTGTTSLFTNKVNLRLVSLRCPMNVIWVEEFAIYYSAL